MWWNWTRRTEVERDLEIARLTKKRDDLLDHAPEAVIVQQAVIVCFLAAMIFLFAGQIFSGPSHFNLGALLMVGLTGTILIIVLYRRRGLPPIGDRWGMSRLLNYEGDSPQDVQNKIDRLRADDAASKQESQRNG